MDFRRTKDEQPEDGSKVVYIFHPQEDIGPSIWHGIYEDGTFMSRGMFCIWHDVPLWAYETEFKDYIKEKINEV